MKFITIGHHDASNWGVADFYDDVRKTLREAFDSGEDFQTQWLPCKKEVRSVRYTRQNLFVTIEVCCEMDDLSNGDLIQDAVWQIDGDDREITDEQMNEILNVVWFGDVTDGVTLAYELPSDETTFDRVISETERLETEAADLLDEYFDRVCNIVREVLEQN